MKILINAFNGGEVSPLLWGRVDLESLRRACRKLRNFIPRVFGGAFRRPSLLHVETAHIATAHVRLIPFNFSAEQKYQIEMGELYMRFFSVTSREVVFGPITTPWPASAVDAVQFVQVNDVMWLTHVDYPVQELIRAAEDSWTLSEPPWLTTANALPPMLDQNVSGITVAIDNTTVGSGKVMTASSALFDPLHVGAFWRIGHYREILSQSLTFDPPAKQQRSSTDLTLSTTWEVSSSGMWSGTLVVERWNPTDNDYDVETSYENAVGNQVVGTGLVGTGNSRFRIRVNNLVVQPHTAPTIITLTNKLTFNNQSVKIEVASPSKQTATSAEIRVSGTWDFSTYGRWSGNVFLEQKNTATTPATWDVIRKWTAEMDRNLSATGEISGNEILRIRATEISAAAASDAAKPRFLLEVRNGLVWSTVKIDDFTSTTQVTCTTFAPAPHSTDATPYWAEGAWSPMRGYPRAAALHEQRLCFAGTRSSPLTMWSSAAADFRNFEETDLEDGAFVYQIAAQESNPIVGMVSQGGLILLTEGDEWLMDGGDGKPLSPSNRRAKRQSRYGSSGIQPVIAESNVLFVQRGSLALLEYMFAWETQNYDAPVLSELVEHMTVSGIRAFGFAQNPERLVWVVTNDGRLLSCTYRRKQQVIAWAQHSSAGTFESVSVAYGAPARGDEVWLVVLRNGTRRIERMDADFWYNIQTEADVVHLDAAVEATEPGAVMTGLAHLNGLEVSIVADGAERPNARVLGGQVSVPADAEHVVVGLPFESLLQPMPFDLPLQDGTAQGRKAHVPQLGVQLYRTQALSYADSENGELFDEPFRAIEDDQEAPPPPFTGLKRLQLNARHQDSMEVILKTSSPLPLNVLGVIPSINVYGS